MKTVLRNSFTSLFLFVLSCSYAQVQLDATGSGNAFSVTYPAVVSSLQGGMEFSFKANHNITGAATLDLNGLGIKPIVKNFNTPLVADDIKSGHFVKVIYDGTNWQMLSSSANASSGGVSGGGTNTGVAFFNSNNTITADGANFSFNKGNYTELTVGKTTIKSTSATGDNLAIGANAGNSTMNGTDNSFYGNASGQNNSSGFANSFFGDNSGLANAGGSQNTFFGTSAGQSNTTGNQNIFIGSGAANTQTTGSNNIALGYNAQMGANNLTNAIAIGSGAVVNGSNSAVIGAGITGLGINTSSPTTMLDVNGGARIRNLSASGAVFANTNGDLFVSTASGTNAFTINGTNIYQQNPLHNIAFGMAATLPGIVAGASRYITFASNPTFVGGTYPSFELLSMANVNNTPSTKIEFLSQGTPMSGPINSARIQLISGRSATANGQLAFLTYNGTLNEAMRINENRGVAIGLGYTPSSPPIDGLIVQGNVGIGTTAPSGKLDIRGINATTINGIKENLLQIAASETGTPLRLIMGIKTDVTPANRYTFIEAIDGGPQALVLQPVNGNVGIGTTTISINTRLAIKNGHFQSQQTTAPTATTLLGAGTIGGICTLTGATDVAGQVTVQIGTSPASTTAVCRINYNKSYATPPIVILTPANPTAASNTVSKAIFTTSSINDFTINFGTGSGIINNIYIWNYIVIETQ